MNAWTEKYSRLSEKKNIKVVGKFMFQFELQILNYKFMPVPIVSSAGLQQ
jgi:hypothetical protein